MKTEYQSTIAIIAEVLAAGPDMKAAAPIVSRLMTHMMKVYPQPSDLEDVEMSARERSLSWEILKAGSPYTDALEVPADDFLPQLYPMMVFKLLVKDHQVPMSAGNIENYWEFCQRYGRLIFEWDGRQR